MHKPTAETDCQPTLHVVSAVNRKYPYKVQVLLKRKATPRRLHHAYAHAFQMLCKLQQYKSFAFLQYKQQRKHSYISRQFTIPYRTQYRV